MKYVAYEGFAPMLFVNINMFIKNILSLCGLKKTKFRWHYITPKMFFLLQNSGIYNFKAPGLMLVFWKAIPNNLLIIR